MFKTAITNLTDTVHDVYLCTISYVQQYTINPSVHEIILQIHNVHNVIATYTAET